MIVETEDDQLDEPDGVVRATIASGAGHVISEPRSASVSVEDNDAVVVSIEAAAANVGEGEDVRFNLMRVGDLTVALRVSVDVTQQGDVILGRPPTGVVFAVGEEEAVLIVPTEDDQLDESDGLVEARIRERTSQIIAPPGSASVKVIDDDLPAVSIAAIDRKVTEGENARFSVIRLGDLDVPLSLDLEVDQVGDVIPSAFQATVSFDVGADTVLLTVATEDDQVDEDDGLVRATILSGDGYIISGTATAEVAIADNDEAPAITIADASTFESAGEIVFPVALAAQSGKTITVEWATADGTAMASTDYGAASGSLVFAPGETADTIRIAVVDDLLDEENETFTVSLSNPVNTVLGVGAATGTITDDDLAVTKAWLSRFGRTVASQVVDAVDNRLFSGAGQGRALFIGGMGGAGGPNQHRMGLSDIMRGSSFRYSMVDQDAAGEGAGGWTAWGRGATTGFSGAEQEMTLDGQVASGLVGVDYQRGPFLGGLLLSHSQGDGNFAGTPMEGVPNRNGKIESLLTGIHPYLRVALTDRISAWGLLGRGWGSMTTTLDSDAVDIGMDLGAFGARGTILSPDGATGFGLNLKSDAFFAGMDSERSQGGVPAEEASTRRIRLAMEGSRRLVVGEGGMIGLSLETGLRQDGGDAETGTGLEMGGGVRFSHRDLGLTIDANARALLTHQDEDYEEWGVSGAIVFDPDGTEQGFSMRVRSFWGAAMGGVNRLWTQRTMDNLTRGSGLDAQDARLSAQFNYGLEAFGGLALMTPYANIALAGEDTRAYRLGWQVKVGPSLSIALENAFGDRTGTSLGQGLMLRGSMSR